MLRPTPWMSRTVTFFAPPLKHVHFSRVAFDGDADRLVIADDKGELVDGDEILAIFDADPDLERHPQLRNALDERERLAATDYLDKS